MNDERYTMILTRRFSDGSGGTDVYVGNRRELGAAFARALPVPGQLKRFSLTVELQQAPSATPTPL